MVVAWVDCSATVGCGAFVAQAANSSAVVASSELRAIFIGRSCAKPAGSLARTRDFGTAFPQQRRYRITYRILPTQIDVLAVLHVAQLLPADVQDL